MFAVLFSKLNRNRTGCVIGGVRQRYEFVHSRARILRSSWQVGAINSISFLDSILILILIRFSSSIWLGVRRRRSVKLTTTESLKSTRLLQYLTNFNFEIVWSFGKNDCSENRNRKWKCSCEACSTTNARVMRWNTLTKTSSYVVVVVSWWLCFFNQPFVFCVCLAKTKGSSTHNYCSITNQHHWSNLILILFLRF